MKRVEYVRFAFGRWLIHAGLRALPPGKSRRELTELFQSWGDYVRMTVAAHQIDTDESRRRAR